MFATATKRVHALKLELSNKIFAECDESGKTLTAITVQLLSS